MCDDWCGWCMDEPARIDGYCSWAHWRAAVRGPLGTTTVTFTDQSWTDEAGVTYIPMYQASA